jgi:NAD/NADP transhydrogenase alpha subunit
MGKITKKKKPAQICNKEVAEDSSAHGNILGYANSMPERIKKTQLKTISFRKASGELNE